MGPTLLLFQLYTTSTPLRCASRHVPRIMWNEDPFLEPFLTDPPASSPGWSRYPLPPEPPSLLIPAYTQRPLRFAALPVIRHRALGTSGVFLMSSSWCLSLKSLFSRGATGRFPHDSHDLFLYFLWVTFRIPKKRSRWLPRAAHGEAKCYSREILAPKWLQKWKPKVIEFWLRWNCNFCYPSHAKSTFSLSRTPPKMVQNLCKKNSATRPPQNLEFSTSGRLWMATWTERASKRGSFWGGREHQKSKKAVPKGGQSAVENRLLKTDRVFLQMGAKMYSQSNII